ncbi:signal transduction histidine kinase [Actinokineospora baliensis]|uniref:sensor histidine kinase n=1 Tax=Actinokineospora baliensis TaxID=547056 RepID=UPI0019588E3E|nr:sensor histidine kinase [Actinokineospora baliensis]MBM7776035.1 signal transduction histidine kinase [Actinokineospora baliensis]
MLPRTAWQAMAQKPLSFVTSPWPWRALLYLASGVALGAATLAVIAVLATTGTMLLVVGVGAVVLCATVFSGIYVARFERWRLRLVDLDPAPDPHQSPAAPGLRGWFQTRLHEPVTWRELGYTAVSMIALWWLDAGVLLFALGAPVLTAMSPLDDPSAWPWVIVAVALVPSAPYTITAWAGCRAALTRAILAPRDNELGDQLTEITRSRARLVDAFELERGRIERDLHDGAQQRLVTLSMTLGMARLDLEPGSAVDRQLELAQEQVSLTLGELRDLIRGVHPQVLVDSGLTAAVEDIATRFAIPVEVDLQLPVRLPRDVELAGYFLITEALANIAKHSRATQAAIRGRLLTDLFVLEVRDNGVGGADSSASTGLTGLADRVAVLNGRLRVSSPPGGPTLLHVEIPCRFA